MGLGAGEPMIVRLLAGAGYRGAAIGVLDGMFLRWSVWCVFTPPVWSVSICSGGIAIVSDHGVKWGVLDTALQGVFGRSLWRVGWGGIVLLGC